MQVYGVEMQIILNLTMFLIQLRFCSFKKSHKKMRPHVNGKQDTPFRIATIGESSVGKTSIIKIVSGDPFDDKETATVGVDFGQISKTVGNKEITLEIWDTAGQERFRSLVPVYCRNVNAAFAIFDLTSMDSFEKLDSWIHLFMSLGDEKRIVFIIGNKADLKDTIQVPFDKAKEWSEKNGYKLFLVSAKTGEGIKQMVDEVIQDLLVAFPQKEQAETIVVNPTEETQSGCC